MAVTSRRPRQYKPETKYEMNLVKQMEHFHSEDKCRELLEGLRWPDGIQCPRCESKKISRSYARNQFVCDSCAYNFSVTSGTMLHDTRLPLQKWFLAVYMMVDSKKGMSANQLKRSLDVSYKTAWYLCHRIREAMGHATDSEGRVLLTGTIEMDETFVGGKTEGKGRGYKGNKALVVGVVERGGEMILQIATDRTRKTLHEIGLKHIAPEAVAIFTDEWPAYAGIGDHDTRHGTVNHSQDEYVRGDVHTNIVEGVWSLLKRSIIGAFHHVSIKHLDKYLSELEWRYGNRENPYLFRDTLMELLQAEHLEYQELVS
jgi:transposase-like protein/IS1 family transposase